MVFGILAALRVIGNFARVAVRGTDSGMLMNGFVGKDVLDGRAAGDHIGADPSHDRLLRDEGNYSRDSAPARADDDEINETNLRHFEKS